MAAVLFPRASGRVSPGFLPILAHLESNALLLFGDPLTRLEADREVTGRFSRVLRVRVLGAVAVRAIYIKRYEPRSGAPEEELRFRTYVQREFERLHLAARSATEYAGVPRPIAYLPDHFAVVTEEADGVGLDRMLKRLSILRSDSIAETVERAMRGVGQWLYRFQAEMPVTTTRVRNYRDYLDIRLRELVDTAGNAFREADRRAALAFFDAQAPQLSPDDLAPVAIHADLCPSNVLVRKSGVTLLDLGMSANGTRYHDLTHLFMHLELAGRRFHLGRTLIDRFQRALVDGYEPGLDVNAPLFRIMLLQHTMCHLAEVARLNGRPANVLATWRARRRVAECFEIGGVG